MPGRILRAGSRLLRLGYPVVPIAPGTKFPGIKGWQNVVATPELLAQWDKRWPEGGIGIQTAHFPFFDNDSVDPKLAAKVEDIVIRTTGSVLVTRHGKGSKVGYLFRTDEPFPLLSTGKWVDWLGQEC